ncbi:DUF6701 domain-containing protein [Photobacterium damselae subsp. damselae]|uniref:DUF6701 domain-containing protein n=1 Tax=Photobacterium damselae TaxID=38293 RepID=UPI0030F42805
MRYFIILLWLLLSSNNVFAAKHSLNTQSFIDSMDVGRYNVANNHTDKSFCIKNNCTIRFNKTFDTIPVVFLMNTVNFNDENDQPSALMIKSITKSSVTFQQVMAPDNKKPKNVIPKPMTLINYLAVEKGAYKLPNNSYVIVNSIRTNKFQYKFGLKSKGFKKPSNYNKWELVNLHSYSTGIDLKEKPGVLHQKQTANNDMWLTTTVANVDKNKFDIALEKSEIDGYKEKSKRQIPSKEETIGFLAGVGDFSYQDLRMLFGIQKTKDTLQLKDPITSGCGNYVDFTPPFNSIPFIFANKDARNGPDGGWVRLCRSQSDKASFAIDEDMDTDPQRDHKGEIIGYVAIDFYKPKPPIDEICRYFPSTVSSNDDDGEVFLSENSVIQGQVPNFTLDFDEINTQGNGRQDNCQYGNEKWKCELSQSYNPVPELHITHPPIDSVYYPNGILEPGSYGDVEINGKTLELKSGDYFFNKLNLYGSSNIKLVSEGKVRIFAKIINSNNANINADGNPSNLLIYATGDINFMGYSKKHINALVYSLDTVIIHGNITLTGAVTSEDLTLYSSAKIISQNYCINPPVEKNKLIITPQISYGLTCERIPIDFYVYHENGSQNTDFVGNITIKPQKGICWSTSSDGYCFSDSSSVPISGGHIKLYMQSLNVGDVYINANLTEDAKIMASGGPYRFAPYGFRINGSKDIPLIAGQPKAVSIEAVASSGAQCSIIKDYQGSPQLIFSDMKGGMPQHISQPLNINGDLLTTNKELGQKLSFHNGISNLDLTYSDAGSLSFSVSDPKWVPQHCAQRSYCSDWEDNWPGLQGKGVINSRPWTFAICPMTINDGKLRTADGNSQDPSSESFVAAGSSFNIVVKPLIWKKGDPSSDTAMIDVSKQEYCSRPVTHNFFAKDAPSLNSGVQLSNGGLHSPTNGVIGSFISTPQTDNSQVKFSGLLIKDNSWSEVGSLWVEANLTNYLGMKVNPSERHIGRFYPHHFVMTEGGVQNAHDEVSPFTYMDQPFTTSFVVEAKNLQEESTTNYGLFNQALKQSTDILAREQVSGAWLTPRLDQSALPSGWNNNWNHAQLVLDAGKVTFMRKISGVQTTVPDGPYKVKLGVRVLPLAKCPLVGCPTFKGDSQHPLWFWKEHDSDSRNQRAAVIPGLIDSRYGRMVLQDAAGDIRGPVAIPLRIEYWNGAAFETNADDSGSHFDGRNYCRQILYPQPDKGNSPSTSGLGNIDRGIASDEKLVAYPDVPVLEPFKQQVRFWQRLSNSTEPKGNGISCRGTYTYQPWLSYNWRKQGDEDPSAIVTFGVYQGNKRIIYRAEAGVTSSNYQ